MKFDCGPTSEEKDAARSEWHVWFAWFPVRVGPRDCRWLEYVSRKGTYPIHEAIDYFDCDTSGWTYEYSAIKG